MPSAPSTEPTGGGTADTTTESVPAAIDTSRLATFFGTLLALVVGFVVAARVASVRLVAVAPVYMFTPLVAAAVTMLRSDVSLDEIGGRIGRLRWYLAAAVAALALVVVALGVAVAMPGVAFDPTADPTPGIGLPSGAVGVVAVAGLVLGLGMTVNAAFALGEEAGWRGYLLWELAPLGFWRASALIGVCWGLWHAPVILDGYNYPSFPLVGVLAMTAATVAFSPLYTYVCLRARSVLAAAAFHGVFNAAAGIVTAYAAAETTLLDELVASPVGLGGIAAFGLATAALAAVGTPELSRSALGGERSESDGSTRG
ncbi:CPBP family intramembrane glutamic endopeptidase [Halobellus rubicundus]|uniref:CPBP family intramembrane glutamic endopeptidase n=1 Tax=Halobellus rubicundus TaxID=2996466 RepID=A0ABD5M796_9EURY